MGKENGPWASRATGGAPPTRRVLIAVGVVLFLQQQLLLLTTMFQQEGWVVAERHFFAMDFWDFVVATNDWIAGRNPYLNVRFNKPPLTLLLGLPFHRVGFAVAADVFFFANLVVVTIAVWQIAKLLGFGRSERWLLLAITSLYYPFQFLLLRGNLDGLMLGLTAIVLCSKSRLPRIAALAISVNLKAYTALLLVPLALKRWREALAAAIATILMVLPFWRMVVLAMHPIGTRGVLGMTVENLSPGGFLANIVAPHPGVRFIYAAAWLGGYCTMMYRRKNASFNTLAILSLAWTVAFPLTVIPYTGVMLLPVLALRVKEMTLAPTVGWVDRLFLFGFLLTGIQQYALFIYYGATIHSHQLFPGLNYLGTTLLLASLVLQGAVTESVERVEPSANAIPSRVSTT